MISLGCLALGTFLYSLALTYRSIVILFIGRALFGYGGARILTRKFFAKFIHVQYKIFYSAVLVGVTGVAMTFGPGLSALLETIIDSTVATNTKLKHFAEESSEVQDQMIENITGFKILGMKFARVNYVTLVTFVIFLILIVLFIIYYEDAPAKEDFSAKDAGTNSIRKPSHDQSVDQYERKMSEIKGIALLPGDQISSRYKQEERKNQFDEWKNKLTSAQKFFTDGQTYYVCLYFLIIKAIQECIIVESPAYIVNAYNHTTALSGLIFFLFTFFTLPAALTPSLLKKKFEDRKMLTIFSILLLIAMLIKIQYIAGLYPFALFIAGSCLVLGFALSVETCCSSIITKVISEKKANSFWNAGLMAGLIDTLGRVAGSTSITIISFSVETPNLDNYLFPIWFGVFFCVASCLYFMYSRLDTKSYFRFETR